MHAHVVGAEVEEVLPVHGEESARHGGAVVGQGVVTSAAGALAGWDALPGKAESKSVIVVAVWLMWQRARDCGFKPRQCTITPPLVIDQGNKG